MEGNSEAFEAVFRANYDDLHRFAVRRVGPNSAPDVVAEVFLVAWRRWGQVPVEAPRLWLFGVAAKVIANEHRGQLRRERLLSRAAAEPVVAGRDPAEALAAQSLVRAALATLPAHEQEVLRLTEWEQLTATEAAQVAGCSHATLRVRLHRARRHLAAALAEADAADTEVGSVTPGPLTRQPKDVIA
ncbi:sigma-70 family RNA polymerase sigma factor [Jatrophihabitans sp.]|uniref:RNA polymerase sigma factor n=1 Tax=Jatrophihabitans sp. TaxID=1932789 RepID=UPI0030C72CA5|nr:hypothetical protein [Jatrophihabitans sp.]